MSAQSSSVLSAPAGCSKIDELKPFLFRFSFGVSCLLQWLTNSNSRIAERFPVVMCIVTQN